MSLLKFVPESCLVCSSSIKFGEIFCDECDKFALDLSRPCGRCGAFTLEKNAEICPLCSDMKLYFDRIYSPFIYAGAISKVISEMKYGPVYQYAVALGRWTAKQIPEELLDVDAVIFPAMTVWDRFKRSFNQAEVIADRIALKHKIPFERKLLKKIKKTKPQADLSFDERKTNLKDAFALKKSPENKKYLLVDDVATTLSTVNTIAELLKKNGAKTVNVVTVARKSNLFD